MEFSELLGKTLVSVEVNEDDTVILFKTADETFKQFHYQDCCESVYIESVVGDWADLIGNPILKAEEVINGADTPDESMTYSFYKLATIRGYVDIRWVGTSNGYYSETVDFERVE